MSKITTITNNNSKLKQGSFIFKQILLHSILVWSLLPLGLHAQRECGTPAPAKRRFFSPEELQGSRMTGPYKLKILVHVFADNNGNNRAATDSMIIVQLENMREFYSPHDICFQLTGIQQINNTDLNNHDVDEENELLPFLVPDVIDIFIHSTLNDGNETLNGSAYHIPNTYFSVVGTAIMSTNNRSTTAHEMGHCLGLLHTFAGGDENVDRSGGCANCTLAGDGLCDTEADPHSDDYNTENVIDTLCNYFGMATDACNAEYNMDPHNVMAYGRRPCRDVLTNGQGAVMRMTIGLESSLTDCLTPQNVLFSPVTNTVLTQGYYAYTAFQTITVQGVLYELSGNAGGYFGSPSTTVLPNVHFAPNTGTVVISAHNELCD